jgi:lipoprotein-anchoring transpeptidase ErfK/SrfK
MRLSGRFATYASSLVLFIGVTLAPAAALAAPGPDPATWVVTLDRVTAFSAPSDQAISFGDMPAQVTLQLLDHQGDWAHVLEPRSRTVSFVPSEALAPGDAPSPYLLLPPPNLANEFEAAGVVTDPAPMTVYPTWADEAVDGQLNPNTWLKLTGTVTAEVFVPERTEDFTGHWIDVNLSVPARVTAYEGDTPVNSFLTIKGAGPRPTPTGVFTILRRVANETMNSDTIGIPRFGAGGYYLTGVLFTQYFTGDGASLHYNYWSSMWG